MSSQPGASLVVRPEKLGDLVVATPVFKALKESFPDSPLCVLTDNVFADIIRHDPFVDRIVMRRRPSERYESRGAKCVECRRSLPCFACRRRFIRITLRAGSPISRTSHAGIAAIGSTIK